jgi:hypothetical protein
MAVSTLTEIRRNVQDLGKIRKQIDDLKGAERQLSGIVMQKMQSRRVDLIESKQYLAALAERSSLKIDPAKLRRKAGEKLFMALVRVDLKAARTHFQETDLKKLGEITTKTILNVSRRPKL